MTNQKLSYNYSDKYKESIDRNTEEIRNYLGIDKVVPMTIKEADQQAANPFFNKENGYMINCQTCVPTYLLRLRGLNVTAGKVVEGNLSDHLSKFETSKDGKIIYHCWDCYAHINVSDVSPVLFQKIKTDNKLHSLSAKVYLDILEDNTKEKGLYQMAFKYKSKLGGGHHVIALQRCDNDKLYYLDPQLYDGVNILTPIEELVLQIDTKGFGGILRIDDKIIKRQYAEIFKK